MITADQTCYSKDPRKDRRPVSKTETIPQGCLFVFWGKAVYILCFKSSSFFRGMVFLTVPQRTIYVVKEDICRNQPKCSKFQNAILYQTFLFQNLDYLAILAYLEDFSIPYSSQMIKR